MNDFYNKKSFITLLCKLCAMQTKYFGMYVQTNLQEFMMVSNSRIQAFIGHWGTTWFCKNLWSSLEVLDALHTSLGM